MARAYPFCSTAIGVPIKSIIPHAVFFLMAFLHRVKGFYGRLDFTPCLCYYGSIELKSWHYDCAKVCQPYSCIWAEADQQASFGRREVYVGDIGQMHPCRWNGGHECTAPKLIRIGNVSQPTSTLPRLPSMDARPPMLIPLAEVLADASLCDIPWYLRHSPQCNDLGSTPIREPQMTDGLQGKDDESQIFTRLPNHQRSIGQGDDHDNPAIIPQ